MPEKYEALRDKFIGQGMTPKAAQRKAARIYNSQLRKGDRPVGRKGK